ncbi:hypothetical protein VOLCADRAFT_107758 [Volvox carteri f. nagariensis]|uniref:Uncharacterized protein n=1 Tax=Volvox carteri f. nagariensis TaxID=3068 RepID=D8UG62_VOLCA|nr:uncharacterized protein VOLCADRAFT_107758 [Volvox carteri f. nagariensis]EFJ41321.1 hypothetical protein VOLCADRAFT_107758 [Volvox carteri f. nagariensis]|eukprot:XP_002957655.1 hypothetical protein VOLCADRAFT_107758 [Volvox carteri f. nagariensis]
MTGRLPHGATLQPVNSTISQLQARKQLRRTRLDARSRLYHHRNDYCLTGGDKKDALAKLNTIKEFYGKLRPGPGGGEVPAMLDARKLSEQATAFITAIKTTSGGEVAAEG